MASAGLRGVAASSGWLGGSARSSPRQLSRLGRRWADRRDGEICAMAGFDFEFTYSAAQEPIVTVCLSAARARARRLGLRWRWRTVSPRRLLVVVDGNSRRLDLLGYRLERDLPLVAEGCDAGSMTRVERQRVGRGLVNMMLRGRHVDQYGLMFLRDVSETRWSYPPYDYECRDFPRLHARLSTTQEVIVGWNFMETAAEVLLEELHTACELVLEETVNKRSKRQSFAQLVRTANEAGLLRRLSNNETPPSELLVALKDLRKDVRHRGAEGAEEWLDEHWEEVAILLERLVTDLNRRGLRGSLGEGRRHHQLGHRSIS